MARFYVSQGVVDRWLSEGRVQLEGDLLRMPAPLAVGGGRWSFFLNPALLFEALDGPGTDEQGLLGTVRSIQDVVARGGEHAETTAVIGPATYVVRPGFMMVPVGHDGAELMPDPPTWVAMLNALRA